MHTRSFVAGLAIGIAPGVFFAVVPHPTASAEPVSVLYPGAPWDDTHKGVEPVQEAIANPDNEVVFVGGTGTGLVPHNPTPSPSFYEPFQDASDPRTLAVCLSKGAQVCGLAEQQDTSDTRYVLLLHPDDDTGISRRFGLAPPKVDYTHDVTIVTAEYDAVSDFPDRPLAGFGLSGLNSLAGWAWDHNRAGDGSANDPLTRLDEAKVTTTKNPNGTSTTRMLIPTHAMPILKPLRDTEFTLTGDDKFTRSIEPTVKRLVDQGYDRDDEPADENDPGPKTGAESDDNA